MHWVITSALCLGRSARGAEYSLRLARGDERANAVVDVWSRDCAGQWDPAVEVVECDDADARAWLEELEHERVIADRCFERSAA
jgi:hypothetical protein